MAAGITVYNTNKNLVLDETYQNFYLTGTGRKEPEWAVTAYNGAHPPKYYGYVDENNGISLNGKPTEQRRLPFESILSTKNEIVAVGCSNSNLYKTYTFKNEPQAAGAHGVGLQVFNAAGKCIYDSNWKRLKVLFFGGDGYKLPTDRELAIVNCCSFWGSGIKGANNYMGGSWFFTSSAVIPENGYTKLRKFFYEGLPIMAYGSPWGETGIMNYHFPVRQAYCMVIDVTGY